MISENILFISPVLNEETRILELVQSLKNQTSQDWLLVVIDNASEDRTCSLVYEESLQDARVKLISMKTREPSIQESWMRAIRAALHQHSHTYTQIIPGDDALENRDYVKEILSVLKSSKAPGVIPAFRYPNQLLKFEKFSRLSFYQEWTHVHLIFGAYTTAHFQRAFSKFEVIEKKGKEFDWWLAFFLFSKKLVPNSKAIMFRYSEIPNEKVGPQKLTKSLILKNFLEGVMENFGHFVKIGKGFSKRDRIQLVIGFIVVTSIELFKFVKLAFSSLIVR
jgi:glycosyltransferase involved in cell wall biosynthesis